MNKQIKTLFYIKQANGELLYVANSNGGPELSANAHAEIVAKVPQALNADIYAVSEGTHKLVWKAQFGTKKPVEEVVSDEIQEAFDNNETLTGHSVHAEKIENLESYATGLKVDINRQNAKRNELESKIRLVGHEFSNVDKKLKELEVRTTEIQTVVNDNRNELMSGLQTAVRHMCEQDDRIRLVRRTLAWLIFSVFFFGLALMAKIVWG